MSKKDKQYTIYIRSTKESVPVSKEEFDAYYHDINIYRIRQQRHGRCVCPASKRLTCDMDCLTCPFHRMGDMRSLDYTETDGEGNETAWVDEIPDDSPLLEDIIIEASEMKALYARLTKLPGSMKSRTIRLYLKTSAKAPSSKTSSRPNITPNPSPLRIWMIKPERKSCRASGWSKSESLPE